MPAHTSLVNICGWIAQLIQDLWWKHSLFWNYRNCWAEGIYSCIFFVSIFPSVLLLVDPWELRGFFVYFFKAEIIEELPFLVKCLGACRNTTIKHFHANGLGKDTCKSHLWRNNIAFILWRSWLERKCSIRKLILCINYRQLGEYHGYLQMVLPTCLTKNGMVCLCRETPP